MPEKKLLSIILGKGPEEINETRLSTSILSEHSLHGLLNVSRSELEDLEGVSGTDSCRIKALAEIAKRMQREERDKIETLEDVRSETADMKFLNREEFRVFMLSSGNEVLKRQSFDGGATSVKVEVQDILRSAVSSKAAALIAAHNHPSGESEPTEADRRFTRELNESAEVLGIDLLDHVIMGEEAFSFRRDCSDVSL